MSHTQAAQQLFAEIGPLIDGLHLIEHDKEGQWSLAFDEDTILLADYEPDFDRLTMRMEVAAIDDESEESQAEIHKMLLSFNYFWRNTDGLCMSIDPEGVVVQSINLSLACMNAQSLANVVCNLAERVYWWRGGLAPPEEEDGESPVHEDFDVRSAMRV